MSARCVVWFALLAALVGCKLSPGEYEVINAWLRCNECLRGERAKVKALGERAVHTLDLALVSPSPARIANMEAQWRQAYSMLGPTPPLPETAYLAQLRSDYIAGYQIRAALSLGDINGRRARAALRRALDNAVPRGYRADVVKTIQAVLLFAETPPFAGSIRPRAARAGDTVVVGEGNGLAWDGDESVILHGSPFADSVLVLPRLAGWTTDSLAFLAAAAPGPYAVSVTNLGPQALTQVAPLQIVSTRSPPTTPGSAIPVTPRTVPQSYYVPFMFRAGDTTAYFRFEPSAAVTVSATALDPSQQSPSIRWYQCAPFVLAVLGPGDAVRGYVVDGFGVPVANAQVTIIGTTLMTTTDSRGRFSISGLPPAVGGVLEVRVTKIGLPPVVQRVQVGADSVAFGFVPTAPPGAVRVGAVTRFAAGTCRLLEIRGSSSGGPRIVKVKLETR
jgi:hypothetical protein